MAKRKTNEIPKIKELRLVILAALAENGPMPRKGRIDLLADRLDLGERARKVMSGSATRFSKRIGQASFDCRGDGLVDVPSNGKHKGSWRITKKGRSLLKKAVATAEEAVGKESEPEVEFTPEDHAAAEEVVNEILES